MMFTEHKHKNCVCMAVAVELMVVSRCVMQTHKHTIQGLPSIVHRILEITERECASILQALKIWGKTTIQKKTSNENNNKK